LCQTYKKKYFLSDLAKVWTTSSPKHTVRQQLQWPTISFPGKEVHSIFQHWKPLISNPKTNYTSMSLKRIRLFLTNFS